MQDWERDVWEAHKEQLARLTIAKDQAMQEIRLAQAHLVTALRHLEETKSEVAALLSEVSKLPTVPRNTFEEDPD